MFDETKIIKLTYTIFKNQIFAKYSDCQNTEWPKYKLRRNPNGRELKFQTTCWSFKPNVTSLEWFSYKPHWVWDFLVWISDSVQNPICLGMELKPAVWIPNQFGYQTFTVFEKIILEIVEKFAFFVYFLSLFSLHYLSRKPL